MDQMSFEDVVEEFHDVLACLEFESIEDGWVAHINFTDGGTIIVAATTFEMLLWDVRNALIYGAV